MTLIVDRTLIDRIRASERTHGTLHVDAIGAGGLVRSAGSSAAAGDSYGELLIEGRAEQNRVKIPFVKAEPPPGPSPLQLAPAQDFTPGQGRGSLGAPAIEPWRETFLDRASQGSGLVFIGREEIAHFLPRRAAEPFGTVWYRNPVTLHPVDMPDTGINPALAGLNVVLTGAGSLGSLIASFAAAAGVGQLTLIDPDVLGRENLRRHLCGREYVGLPKVEAVAHELERRGFAVPVIQHQAYVHRESADEFRALMQEADLLICSADSAPAQQFVNHAGVTGRLPTLIASVLTAVAPLGEVVVVSPDHRGCFACWRREMEKKKVLRRSNRHDPVDYPGPEYSRSGLPFYQLAAVAAAACDLAAVSVGPDRGSCVWQCALDAELPSFPDLSARQPAIVSLTTTGRCEVCQDFNE